MNTMQDGRRFVWSTFQSKTECLHRMVRDQASGHAKRRYKRQQQLPALTLQGKGGSGCKRKEFSAYVPSEWEHNTRFHGIAAAHAQQCKRTLTGTKAKPIVGEQEVCQAWATSRSPFSAHEFRHQATTLFVN
eukprot:1157900-Pelagomonas_calceolata.AAC.24